MAQPFELKFSVDTADVASGLTSLLDGLRQVTQGVADTAIAAKQSSEGYDSLSTVVRTLAPAIVALAAATGEAVTTEESEAAEVARLTEMLGSEERARGSLAARIIDMTATTVASDEEIAASMQRRAEIMADVTAAQEARLAVQTEVAQATVASASEEVAAAQAVQQVQAVAVSDATRLALAKGELAEANANLRVQLDDLAQAQRNLAEIEQAEPGNLAAIARAQSELAAEAARVAEAEDVAAKAVERLAAAQAMAAKPPPLPTPAAGGGFTQQTQELGQLLTMLGLVDPQLLRVGIGVQMVGQAVSTLGPMIAEAGGSLAGFVAVLGPMAAIAGGATLALGALAEAASFVGASIKAAIPAQESETTFALLLGNVENARARMEELDAAALKFHLDPDQLRDADAQLTRLSQGALGGGASINTLIQASARSQQPLAAVGAVIGRLYETIQNGSPIGRMGAQLVRTGIISAATLNALSNLQKEGAKGPEIWAAFEAAVNKAGGAAEARATTFEGATKGISGAWTELLEAFGRPIVDTLTPFLQRAASGMAALVPYAHAAGLAIGQFSGAILNSGSSLSLVAQIITGQFGPAIGHTTGLLLTASPLVSATCGFIGADVKAVFALVSATLVGFVSDTVNTLTGLFDKALAVTGSFVKGMASLLSALPGNVASSINSGVDGVVAGSKTVLDGIGAGLSTLSDKAKKLADDATANAEAAAKRVHDALNAGQPAAPNSGKQFATPDPNAVVTPDAKAGRGGGGAKEIDEATAAEKRYKAALEDVKGELGAGEISQEKATAAQVKATQEYIASMVQMQAQLSPTSDKFHLLQARIEEARASLLKMKEGQEEYQSALAATSAALEAGNISQAEANAENATTIAAFIARLKELQGEVEKTSEKYRELQALIDKANAKLEQTSAWGQIKANLRNVMQEWGDLGKQVNQVINSSMNSGISAVSQGLTGLITKTGDWKQTFTSAVDSMLQGLIELGVKTVMHYALMGAMMLAHKALGDSTTAGTVATQTGAGVAIAAAHAPAAAATSVSSYGLAAIVGAALAIAAIGAIIALLAGGFEQGGFTGGREGQVAGLVHGEEYVFSAPAVRHWGVDALSAMSQMRMPVSMPRGASMEAASSGYSPTGSASRSRRSSGQSQHHTYVFFDENAMAKHMSGITGTKTILNAVTGASVQLGLKSKTVG